MLGGVRRMEKTWTKGRREPAHRPWMGQSTHGEAGLAGAEEGRCF